MRPAVERDVATTSVQSAESAVLPAPYGPAPIFDDAEDRWGGHALPGDHPAWMKDTLSISQRARALLTKLRPVVLRVVTYWEHKARSIVCAGRRLSIDQSGSYRLD
ncbi:MAG: hypothetical protein GIX03_06390 [Candidatus Eremiobacteraeota bacterium]|nr:hypothetical protein [Candidatus Eremiobacteraeota bacterium]MBC5802625.1 hypothetical protein [Candidatus Eremiobacteraeota bacterium]MBC5822937.1 hypothetical protein [Candidatus Eremiobacteraeota bacterium]